MHFFIGEHGVGLLLPTTYYNMMNVTNSQNAGGSLIVLRNDLQKVIFLPYDSFYRQQGHHPENIIQYHYDLDILLHSHHL